MGDISISLVSIISAVLGAVVGTVITILIIRRNDEGAIKILKMNVGNAETLKNKNIFLFQGFEEQVDSLKKQLTASSLREHELQAEKIKFDAIKMKEVEEAKRIAYEVGANDALRDFQIVYTPFIYKDGLVRKKAVAGYRYQFYVKGIPAFAPINVVTSEESGWDDDIKQGLLNTVNQAIAIAGKQWGGIPFDKLPVVHKMPEITHK